MSDNNFPNATDSIKYSKFVNDLSSDDFVEIPLSSDGENDDCRVQPISTAPKLPTRIESNCTPEPDANSVVRNFFQPVFAPSPKHIISGDTYCPTRRPVCQDDDDPNEDFSLNEELANSLHYQCSLLSPSLVQAINSDIREIKRSLAVTDNQNGPNKANHHGKHHHQHKQSDDRQRSVFGRKNHRTKMIKSTSQTNGGKGGGGGGDEKNAKTVRQWNFAPPSNVAYSSSSSGGDSSGSRSGSSSSNGSPSSQNGSHRPTSGEQAPPTETATDLKPTEDVEEEEEVQWSLKRIPPKPLPERALEASTSHSAPPRQIRPKKSQMAASAAAEPDYGSDEDTDQLLNKQYRSDRPVEIPELQQEAEYLSIKKRWGREVAVRHPDFPDRLIEGRLYRSRYLGSTQLLCEGHPSKMNRLHQAQEAVQRVKAPEGENQPSVPVELFVSIERILILNKELDEIVMDHDLRLISYIADVGSILVLMVRRPPPTGDPPTTSSTPSRESKTGGEETPESGQQGEEAQSPASSSRSTIDSVSGANRQDSKQPPTKIICHLFESDETQAITQAIGKAFQEAYFEFLRQNGVEDPEAFQERNYENILLQQEVFRNELPFFSDRKQEKEVIVPKARGEALGVVIVDSGWGSVLPTAVLANMHPAGPAARCGQLNIGNRIISINGKSLVGLPLPACRALFKATKNQTAVKLVVVNCSPVVEVLIRRPDLKFQLGFSVQDGVICSLLRGGIAERGGIRVDHRIIEINGESVVAVPHDYIVNLLATAVGEIYIRTMPTSIFRLLTGQETPHYI